jgi:hypothetical protein
MKVYLGPYKDWWIGPYQISESLKIFGVPEYRREAVGKYLADTWVKTFCEWMYNHNPLRHRKIKVRIDHYDVWSMNTTLSYIIHPMLIRLKKVKHGAPYVEDSDVPEHLRSTAAPPKEKDWDTDDFHFDRFDWILDEMIWAFDYEARQKDEESFIWRTEEGRAAIKAMNDRVANGHRLFGVYFQGLWD